MRKTVIRVSGSRSLTLAGACASLVVFSVAAFFAYGPVTQTRASIGQFETRQPVARQVEKVEPSARIDSVTLASPGRIEGKSDSIEVGAAIDGVIQSIPVREGEQVTQGQVVAVLDCRDLQSVLPVARAEAESLRQVRERLLRGSRDEERAAAAQKTAAVKAVLAQASAQLERNRKLAESDLISRDAYDQIRRDAEVAEAQYQGAKHAEELVNAPALPEEVARADSDYQAALERITLAEEKLGKCSVRAPADGTILRILLRPGESFALVSPRPVLTIADLSGRRVRAEVDERDVGKVHVGQRILVSSEAFSGRRFGGKVTRLSSVMGRKSVLTGDPADKSDRDILEVIAQLDPAATALPIGLRVTVEFGR
jgi:HlyD family secretion protein